MTTPPVMNVPIVQARGAWGHGDRRVRSRRSRIARLRHAERRATALRLGIIRQRTSRPINVNFFCHTPPEPDAERQAAWRKRLAPYYAEFGLDAAKVPTGPCARRSTIRCARWSRSSSRRS
jgi:nitronate monooxygenase